ncbi:MAG: hypothetical protein JO297_06320 [Nitrososphaeraceae archaeon]|nr:hypothetical protein [Nitrososphaeraceae archaeon]
MGYRRLPLNASIPKYPPLLSIMLLFFYDIQVYRIGSSLLIKARRIHGSKKCQKTVISLINHESHKRIVSCGNELVMLARPNCLTIPKVNGSILDP